MEVGKSIGFPPEFLTINKTMPKPFLILLCCVLLPACADKPEELPKEKKEDAGSPRVVGRVASVPASRKFVLIQAYGSWKVENGAILTTQGPEGRAANLRATGEKLGQYAAADIQSGTLEVGDAVYTIAKLPETTVSTDSTTQVKKTEDPAPQEAEETVPSDDPGPDGILAD